MSSRVKLVRRYFRFETWQRLCVFLLVLVCHRLVKVRLSKSSGAEKAGVGSEHLSRGATVRISASKWICPDTISRQKARDSGVYGFVGS